MQPGLRSRSRDQSWSLSESTVLAGVWVGAGVCKILSTVTPAWSRGIPPVDRRWFWPNGYASSRKHWNMGIQGEWQCEGKVGALFSDRIRSEKSIGENFNAIANVMWLCQQIQRLSYRPHSKESATSHGQLHPKLARTGAILPYHLFGCNQKWIQ